jgi:CRISPR-associated protein Csb1
MNNPNLTQFDDLLAPDKVAALVIREHLIPVEGRDGVFFPSTFADIGYNIDWENPREKSGRNVALIDSVGSQANRIEPMFKEEPYSALVPQITIKAGDKEINLLDAGHRAGDALARCSALQDELQNAFIALQKGDAMPLAKIAPTSLVFGVWDSRDTQVKLPRLIASTVRAFDVRKLTRSAQYWAGGSSDPVSIYDAESMLGPIQNKEDLTQRSAAGFTHVPSTGAHGGIIADGGIRRDAVLALAALRLLKADKPENTLKLQRYILGLALVAFTQLPLGYYRQGTILVLDAEKSREFSQVAFDGTRSNCKISASEALAFAQHAANDFGIGESQKVEFDGKKAREDIAKGKK